MKPIFYCLYLDKEDAIITTEPATAATIESRTENWETKKHISPPFTIRYEVYLVFVCYICPKCVNITSYSFKSIFSVQMLLSTYTGLIIASVVNNLIPPIFKSLPRLYK